MRLPSGEYATELTVLVWPLPVASGPAARSLASHTLTVLSLEPLTMRLPSGEYATELTVLVWPKVTRAGPFSSLAYSRSALPSRSWSMTSSRRVELVSLGGAGGANAALGSASGESFCSVSSRSAGPGEATSVET